MPYITGTANNAADIVSAVRSACTANGWTLTNDILSKGTCYARVWSPSAGNVSVVCGRGQTGGAGSTLTGQSNAALRGIGGATIMGVAFTFPMNYYIHVFDSPDEVYLFVNYNTSYYQRLMFGQSDVAGLTGTGNFYDASRQSAETSAVNSIDLRMSDGLGSVNYIHYPFSAYPNGGFMGGLSGVDHSLDINPDWKAGAVTHHVYNLLVHSPTT